MTASKVHTPLTKKISSNSYFPDEIKISRVLGYRYLYEHGQISITDVFPNSAYRSFNTIQHIIFPGESVKRMLLSETGGKSHHEFLNLDDKADINVTPDMNN